jgi:hypothetical protein
MAILLARVVLRLGLHLRRRGRESADSPPPASGDPTQRVDAAGDGSPARSPFACLLSGRPGPIIDPVPRCPPRMVGPMSTTIKASHKALQAYYDQLHAYDAQGVGHESALRSAFQNLLAETAKARGWTLVPELSLKVRGKTVRPDGTLRDDQWHLPRGYWEAKDTDDVLDDEIRKKVARGYPLVNTIFEDTRQAVLFQNGTEVFRIDPRDPGRLADLLNQFYDHTERDIEGFEQAVGEFQERIPHLAQGLLAKIREAHAAVPRFQAAFDALLELCQTSLNPNLSVAAVDEMLVQHLLTERLFRTVFDNADFIKRNVIAAEVETVIEALVSKSFNRAEFLKALNPFYKAIERTARTIEDFSQKQHFLNSMYERFFQGYSVKVADTHGIVYTPQEIVDFMCASVQEVLKTEFGLGIASAGVNILDPCTGTGNFIVNLMRRVEPRDQPRVYRGQLFANEVMLLPYYIAAQNIEHEYYDLTGTYEPFGGLCFVDTLELAESEQGVLSFMSEENTARVERQKKTPINVVIGNPPYNVGQLNENDNNKNRKDKATFVVNETLSLGEVPLEAFSYRLGNRSALEWVIDQYQVSEDRRSGIRTDPNRADDPEYIVRLVERVVRVSVETVRIVNGLPAA